MKYGLMIEPDGEFSRIEFDNDTALDTLQNAVQGWVQAVDLNEDLTMWLNEEGKLIGLEHNMAAQRLWDEFYPMSDYVVGTVVITGGADAHGHTKGLTHESMERLDGFFAFG